MNDSTPGQWPARWPIHRAWLSVCAPAAFALGACSPAPPTPAPAPAPIIEAAPPVAPPITAPAPVRLRYSTDDPSIGSEVGLRTLGLGTSTTGKAGWLVYGPYVPLAAGNYEAVLEGIVDPGHAGVVYVDVAHAKGEKIVAAVDVDASALLAAPGADGLLVLPFTLAESVTDLEVRVRVTEASNLSVAAYQIRSVP